MTTASQPPLIPDLPAWSAAAARGASSRTLLAGCVASKVVHLTAIAAIYALVASDLLSFSPPTGRQSVELAASFATESAAPPPAVSVSIQPAEHALRPREIAIVPQGELPPPEAGGEATPDLPESIRPTPVTKLQASRRSASESLEQAFPQESSAHRLTKSLLPPTIPTTTTAAEPASASVASQAAVGAKADSLPTAEFCPEPVYPPPLLAARIEGQVVLQLSVAADGTVVEAIVERTSGYAAMDEAALAAVQKWKFRPARRFGLPVAVQVRKPLRFLIEPSR